MTNAQLVEKLKARVKVIEDIGGAIRINSKLVEDELTKYIKEIAVDLSNALSSHIAEAKRRAREQYLAVILLYMMDRG